ncbi:hypothetical protein V6N11_056048 [Hibiscus sabdariffa]|uniref:Uncharacterized protein n=1 Tax=Hibiscus sabdariffa TaxID=183260 RepID=A0ABR2T2N6_9ROSI
MKIIRNVSAFGYLKKSKFVYYRIPAVTFNTASLVLVHDDDTVREVIEILKKKGSVDLHVACLEEVDTVNGGNVVVGSNVAGSSYDHEDHVVGQEHVEVEGGGRDAENGPQHVEVGPEGEDVRPKLAENEPQIGDNESIDGNGLEDVDVGPDAENGPKIVDNESSEDNGSEHVEVRPEITNIWTDHVDVDVGAGVADVNGNGANHIDVDDNGNGADHVDVDDNGNGADHVDVGPDSENGSQHAENGPDSDNGLDHVDIGPEVNEVEPELGDDRLELADDDTTDDNGAEDGLDGSEEDAFLFNIDIRSDVDEEVEDIREKGRGKRHKEKVADREHAANCEGKPVQPDNVDEGYRSSDKDGKLEGYETDYISSSDPGEYEDSLRFDDNKHFKEAVRKYAFAKGGTTQNVASSTTGPPGMVHGTPQNVASPTTQNVGSATTGSLGMVHGTTHNVASATTNPTGMVHSTTQNVASTISQPGTSTERVVTRASKRKSGEADPSQFQYHSKGKGLRWKGNTAVTIRQLQENVETVRKKRGRPPKSQTLGTQSS